MQKNKTRSKWSLRHRFLTVGILCLFGFAWMGAQEPQHPQSGQPQEKKKTRVDLLYADSTVADKEFRPDVQVLLGNVQLKHDSMYMWCDSALIFEKINSVEAFGNVRMEQGDTLFIYGDYLYYDGMSQLAMLREHVRMINRDTELTTDSLNYDRIRTDEEGLWTNLVLGYGDLIQVQVGGSPALTGSADDLDSAAVPGFQDGDFIASVMTKPIDGLAVSVDWAYVGDKASSLKDNYGVVGGAADVNIGALCGLVFDLGVGVADKYYYGTEKNVLSAQVYGGVDAFSIFGEYVLDDDISRVHFGADITAIENVLLNVYGGLGDISEAADSFYVGGNIGYEVCGITFALNLQYASYADGGHSYLHGDGGDKGGDIAQGGVKADGFSITPKISINF